MPGTERERVATSGHPEVGLYGATPWHHWSPTSRSGRGAPCAGRQPGGWVPWISGPRARSLLGWKAGRFSARRRPTLVCRLRTPPRAGEALSGSGVNRHPE